MPKQKPKLPKIIESNWREVLDESIKEGRHVDYLQEVLKKYETYQQEFAKRFTTKNSPGEIYKFRATYLNKKNVWREFEIAGSQYFERLAFEIVYSMDWDNDHMHGFEFPDYERSPDPLRTGSHVAFYLDGWEDDPHPTYKTNDIRICDFDYDKAPKMIMTFDYGDGHRFEVEFKGKRKLKKRERVMHFPKLVDLRGVPPEQYPDWEVVEKEGTPNSEKMHIALWKDQFVNLLTMVLIANMVINGNRDPDLPIQKHKDLYDKLLALAFYKGYTDLVIWDNELHDFFPTKEFDDEGESMKFISEYEEETFWEELKIQITGMVYLESGKNKKRSGRKVPAVKQFTERFEIYDQVSDVVEENNLKKIIDLKFVKEQIGKLKDKP